MLTLHKPTLPLNTLDVPTLDTPIPQRAPLPVSALPGRYTPTLNLCSFVAYILGVLAPEFEGWELG